MAEARLYGLLSDLQHAMIPCLCLTTPGVDSHVTVDLLTLGQETDNGSSIENSNTF